DARAMSYGASHNRYAAIAVEFDVNLLDQVTGSTEVDAVTRHADNRTVLDGNVVFDGANPVIKKIWTWKGVAVWATGSQSPHLTLEKPLNSIVAFSVPKIPPQEIGVSGGHPPPFAWTRAVPLTCKWVLPG